MRNWICLDKHEYQELLQLVTPFIMKQDTKIRKAVTSGERLTNPSILGNRWVVEVGNCQQVDLFPLFHWLDPFILSTFNLTYIHRKLLVMSPRSFETNLSVRIPVMLFMGSNNGVTPYQVRMGV